MQKAKGPALKKGALLVSQALYPRVNKHQHVLPLLPRRKQQRHRLLQVFPHSPKTQVAQLSKQLVVLKP